MTNPYVHGSDSYWDWYYEMMTFNPRALGVREETTEENANMEKQYFVVNKTQKAYISYEDAEKAAKQYTGIQSPYGNNTAEYVICKAMAYTNTPVPSIEVTKLS